MGKYRQPAGIMAVVAFIFALALAPGLARAASEDVAMFYDDLGQYGQWVEYENYGPVWRPSQVPQDWRPYTNGRWVPTNDGNIFESEEPWGWATYHYGNWMPTEGYGWVWVPGSTWYPSTVEWRSSPENEPIDSSYVGWAPTPPPDYVPPQAYAPPSYYQGAPVTDALSSPLWIFARAASFLLGFGQPYTPAYSYVNSGALVPPTYVPVFYNSTVFIPRYVTPAYYPPGFIGVRRFGVGAYNMGPSVTYISRVTQINQTVINRTIYNNSIYVNRFHNVMPPDRVLRRGGFIKNTLPPALVQGKPLPPPHLINNYRMAQANLNKPNFLPPPQGLHRIDAHIPRVERVAVAPGHGLPGTALPARATMPLSPQMTRQINQLPPNQQFVPGKSLPFKPAAATRPGAGNHTLGPQPGQFQPNAPGRPGPEQAVVPGQPRHEPSRVAPPSGYGPPHAGPGYVRPGTQPSSQPKPGEFHPGTRPPGIPPKSIPTTATAPGAPKPSTVPLPPNARGITPDQRRQQELKHQRLQQSSTSGQPPQQQQLQQQQRQLQERQRQQQLQVQPQRQLQMQQQQRHQLERARPQQIQQQRQVQMPQQQRQLQSRPQPQANPRVQAPTPRPQPQASRPQPRPQRQQQENQERGKKGQEIR